MKTSCMKFKWTFFTLVLTGCFLFLTTSCGLDEFYFVESPYYYRSQPSYDSPYTENYFSFYTYESSMSDYLDVSSPFRLIGTDVYYKIYSSYDSMVSERSSLNSAASNNDSSAASKLIDSYKYMPLKYEGQSSAVLIPATGSNQEIYIRLSNYQNDSFKAKIVIGGEDAGVPRRNNGKSGAYSFDFGRSGDADKVPDSDDTDVKYSSSSTSDGKWYVSMFAVALGRDSSYSITYSNIFYLGTVCIDQNSEDN